MMFFAEGQNKVFFTILVNCLLVSAEAIPYNKGETTENEIKEIITAAKARGTGSHFKTGIFA